MTPPLRFPIPLRTTFIEHGAPLLIYTVLSLAITWPTIQHFAISLTAEVGDDPLSGLWTLWHLQQALLGREPLFFAARLYYPEGASLLTHAIGPVLGIIALPFWIFGPEAA